MQYRPQSPWPRPGPWLPTRPRRALATAAALTLAATAAAVTLAGPAAAAAGCAVSYAASHWPGGFTATLTVTNLGDPIDGWTLEWDYPDAGQRVTQAWNATAAQAGRHVTLRSVAWNATVPAGASITMGANGTWTVADPAPEVFTLNGAACTGPRPGSGTPSASRSPSSQSPASRSPSSRSPSGDPPSSSGPDQPREAHRDNPYADGSGYVNPEWQARAESVAGGSRVSHNPTAVWIDSIAKITGTDGRMGLRAHLDAAVAQGATTISVVVNDLPARNCEWMATTGDLTSGELVRYQREFIDPVAAIEADPAYGRLRIVNVLELNSIPLLLTSVSPSARCQEVVQGGVYLAGLRYAIGALHAAGSNVYTYLDAANHSWFGWDTNFPAAASLYASLVSSAPGGMTSVDGFITNAAGYAPLTEPYLTITTTVGGVPVRQSRWADWNSYLDELPYAQALRLKLVSLGFSSDIGMLIDTSRNGWGGPARPTGPSTSTDLNTFVDSSRIDRRIHQGNWCNQAGAGLGERPRPAPAPGIDAYIWLKPPGESDGAAPGDPAAAEPMCDPAYLGNPRNANNRSGALPGAPAFGAWFPAQFAELLANAYPPLP